MVDALIAALAQHGPTTAIDASAVDAALGPAAADVDLDGASELLSLLDRTERAHRFVIYRTDPNRVGWTQRCLRHADRILLVVDGDRHPADVAAPG